MSTLSDLATQAQGYQQLYQEGQLSAEEYKELINDMSIISRIDANAHELEEDDQNHAILMGALQLAEALA